MEFKCDPEKHEGNDGKAAAAYRQLHGRSLMTLNKLRGVVPEPDELCRIRSVETLPPSLWVTVMFLDGSRKSFRPENIRRATRDEVTLSEHEGALSPLD